ncbi:MAG TPA: DciA family protein [Edaphobacter sp.]
MKTLSVDDRLTMAWMVACGPAMAGKASVVGYDEGVVRVEVGEGAWVAELRNLSGHLEAELARISGVKVTKLHFIVKR